MNKNIIIISITVIIIIALILFVGTGFTKNPNVEIIDYSVSEDGKELTFTVGTPFSIGYTRGYKNNGGGVKPHYLNFYNTFGFFNSSWRAKFEYVLDLDKAVTEIYFNRPNGGYELVLQKNLETGEWIRTN